MRYNRVCRVCLKLISDSGYLNLSDGCLRSLNLSSLKEKISVYLPELDMSMRLKYPIVMCSDCIKTIEDFHIFKWKFKETEKLLLEYMNSRPKNDIDEDRPIDLVKVAKTSGSFEINVPSLQNNTHSCQDIKPIIPRAKSNINKDHKEALVNPAQYYSDDDGSDISEKYKIADTYVHDDVLFNIEACHFKIENLEEDISQTLHVQDITKLSSKDLFKYYCKTCCIPFKDRYHFTKHKCATNSGSIKDSPSSLLCLMCNKTISSKLKLRSHFYRNHMTKRRHKCKVCLKAFRDKYGVLIHMRVHTGERPYECEICHKSFTTGFTYKNHKALHDNTRPFPCTLCDKSFINTYELSRHCKSVHSLQKESYECNICSQKLCSKANLRQHKLKHVDNRPFECDICFQRFLGVNYLNSHIAMKHAGYEGCTCDIFSTKCSSKTHKLIHSSAKTYVCDICSKTFIHKDTLKLHKEKRQCLNVNSYKCNLCCKIFAHKYNLEKHINISHASIKKFLCTNCQKRFATREYLSKHSLIHNGEKFECDICTKRFSTRAYLKIHNRVHSEEQPFQCDICGKTYNDKGTLERHILTHSNEKPFACELCPKRYTNKLSLNSHKLSHTDAYTVKCFVCFKQINKAHVKIHMRIHTGEKPFECKICLKRFITLRRVRRHMVVHTKEKQFKCDICYKLYSTLDTLKVHQRIHTGEKPFQCDICGGFFSEKNSVKRHRERVHNNTRFECDICSEKFSTKRAWKSHKLIHNPYECNICKKQFQSIGRLNVHKKTHNDDKPHKCDICQKRFRHAIHLQKHRRVIPEEKPRDCKMCKVKFKYSCESTTHKKCNVS